MTSRLPHSSAVRTLHAVTVAAFLLLVLAPAFVPTMQAQQTQRAKTLGAKMMCVCGCNQILTACNHVGCQYSHAMLKELDDRVARGDSDNLILQSFIQEYGPTVLMEPPAKGFTWLVWIMPIVAPILAFFLIWQVVRRWRRRAVLAPAGGPALSPELLDRARRQAEKEIDE
ncbi:MAG: cytochrome c-type biogenesis protein CcmH [Acidobacteriia bacterium]|nr:cytochrome c-type biogenesis protein CcmH [Terriglobia bacterium]